MARLFEERDVADVKQVETAVGKDQFLSFRKEPVAFGSALFRSEKFRFGYGHDNVAFQARLRTRSSWFN